MRYALIILAVFSQYIFLTTRAFASEVLFRDDFSSGLSKWEPTRDDGSLWTIVQGKVGAKVNTASTVTEIIPKNSLWTYKDSYSISFDMYPFLGGDKNFTIQYINNLTFYELHDNNGTIFLERTNPSNYITFASPLVNNNGPYHFKIDYSKNRIKIWINDVIYKDYTDAFNNLPSGRIGLKVGTGASYPSEVYFDNILVTTLDPESSPSPSPDPTVAPTPSPSPTPEPTFPAFMQSDLEWAHDVYDHAAKWTSGNLTIERWGCSLTTAAMILQYHGITELPNGLPTNPGNLNRWLHYEKDGYLRAGMVNWNAIARATKLNQVLHPDWPALEYRRVGNTLGILETELNADRPLILEEPGHFVAAYQWNSASDIKIQDPLYTERKTLAAYNNTFVSGRSFTPSHTDLSSILVTADPGITLQLQHAQGSSFITPDNVHSYTQQPIKDQITGTYLGTPFSVLEYMKPPAGEYRIFVSSKKPAIYTFSLYFYTQQGEPQIQEYRAFIHTTPQVFSVNFSPHENSTVSKVVTLHSLITEIQAMAKSGQMQGAYTGADLITLLSQAQKYAAKNPAVSRKAFQLFLTELPRRHWVIQQPALDLLLADAKFAASQLYP